MKIYYVPYYSNGCMECGGWDFHLVMAKTLEKAVEFVEEADPTSDIIQYGVRAIRMPKIPPRARVSRFVEFEIDED